MQSIGTLSGSEQTNLPSGRKEKNAGGQKILKKGIPKILGTPFLDLTTI